MDAKSMVLLLDAGGDVALQASFLLAPPPSFILKTLVFIERCAGEWYVRRRRGAAERGGQHRTARRRHEQRRVSTRLVPS